jgi:hypothetical protein
MITYKEKSNNNVTSKPEDLGCMGLHDYNVR